MLGFHPYFDFRHNYNGRAVRSRRRPQFTPMKIPRYVVAQKNKSLFRKYLRPREGYNTGKCSPQQTIQQWSEVQCTSCLDYKETRKDARKIRGQPYRSWIFTTIQDKNVRTRVIWSKVCELQFQKHLVIGTEPSANCCYTLPALFRGLLSRYPRVRHNLPISNPLPNRHSRIHFHFIQRCISNSCYVAK
jgi:hypothetical protein